MPMTPQRQNRAASTVRGRVRSGAVTRANKLTQEKRSAIAKKAGGGRWR
jgi:hypothetical protein